MEAVQVFKLISGEEVIARIDPSVDILNATHLVLNKPRVISIVPGQGGNIGVALMPLSVNAIDDEYVIIAGAFIGYPTKINPNLEKRYLSETSNIQLV